MFDLSGYSEYFTKSIKHSFAFENHEDGEYEDGSTGNYIDRQVSVGYPKFNVRLRW